MSVYLEELTGLDGVYETGRHVPSDEHVAAISQTLRDRVLYAIGSGGALPAAELAVLAHSSSTGRPAVALTPLAFIELEAVAPDVAVIVFSSRAKHPDTALAIAHARGHGLPVVLVTQLRRPELAPALRDDDEVQVLSMAAGYRDGFLATRSTATMAVVIARIYGVELPPRPPHSDLTRVPLRERVLVLYSATGRPAAVDVETRLHELGLRAVQITDFRNFAHGRHVGLHRRLTSTTVIALSDVRTRGLAQKTLETLPDSADVRIVQSDHAGVNAAIELLYAVMPLPLLAEGVTEEDPSKPRVPAWGRRLYHLPYRRSFPPTDLTPVQQKVLAAGFHRDDAHALKLYESAFAAWRRRVRRVPIGCLILDYDGTCVSTSGRFDLPTDQVKHALVRVLSMGMQITFSTGRGDSLYRDLRVWVPEAHWAQIHLELHQGAWPQPLAKPLQNAAQLQTPWIPVATDRLAEFESAGLISVRHHAHQLSVVPHNARIGVEALRRLVTSTLADLSDATVYRSGHSVDVIDVGVGKRRTAELAATKFGEVLAIGDQGALGGNDFELLNRGPLTVSVDECSGAPDRCWRLTRLPNRGPQALVKVLSLITERSGRMYLRV